MFPSSMRSLMTHDVSQAAASMQPTILLELFSRHLQSVKNHLLFPSFPPFLLLRNPSRSSQPSSFSHLRRFSSRNRLKSSIFLSRVSFCLIVCVCVFFLEFFGIGKREIDWWLMHEENSFSLIIETYSHWFDRNIC